MKEANLNMHVSDMTEICIGPFLGYGRGNKTIVGLS